MVIAVAAGNKLAKKRSIAAATGQDWAEEAIYDYCQTFRERKKNLTSAAEDERKFKIVQVQFDHWVQLYFFFLNLDYI